METTNTDIGVKELNLLSTFHYVLGGITAFFSCIPLIHIFIGLAIFAGKFANTPNTSAPPVVPEFHMFYFLPPSLSLSVPC